MSNSGSFILAIDTASRCGSIAVAREGHVVGVWGIDAAAKQSSVLWDDIDLVLGRLGATIRDVTAIAVSRGPGAFTGMRIGLAAAAGLTRATGAALFGATTLELSARSTGGGDEIWAVLNAYRNEVYAQRLRVDGTGEVHVLAEPVVASPAAVFASIDSTSVRIVGDGASVFRDQLETAAGQRGVAVDWQRVAGPVQPTTWAIVPARLCLAAELAELVALRIEKGASPGPVTPCYIRESEAEVNRKAGLTAGAGTPRGV